MPGAAEFNTGEVYEMPPNPLIQDEFRFPHGTLPSDHPFAWDVVAKDPKGDHGTFSLRGNWYKTMTYELLHTGGFLRLCTLRGRVYWNAQNEHGHLTPDWKLHFSVEVGQIPLVWDILAALFMEYMCEIGMKATTISEEDWSPQQRGREITVYLFQYSYCYGPGGPMMGLVPEEDHTFYIGREVEGIFTAPFWFTWIQEAEARLAAAGVRSRGTADGDLALPGCVYASLRNEAFVKVNGGEPEYPPNHTGWNATRQINPMTDVVFMLGAVEKEKARTAAVTAQLIEAQKHLAALRSCPESA